MDDLFPRPSLNHQLFKKNSNQERPYIDLIPTEAFDSPCQLPSDQSSRLRFQINHSFCLETRLLPRPVLCNDASPPYVGVRWPWNQSTHPRCQYLAAWHVELSEPPGAPLRLQSSLWDHFQPERVHVCGCRQSQSALRSYEGVPGDTSLTDHV